MSDGNISTNRGPRVLAMAAAVVLGALALPTTPAVANPATDASVPTMVVLDASGSMNADDAPGPRIDAAKNAVTGLISSLPAEAQVGLQVYGTGTGNSAAEKAAGCQDIETLVPVGPVDPAAFASTVEGIVASGYTPIGAALQAAADALPTEGPRAIVLVSDGIDTCAPPPPCEVAEELAERGIDLTVHTIGFRVDAEARAELECIAEVARGSYTDADSSDELADALRIQVEHAVSGYDAEGTPISGTSLIASDTPVLTPGQYIDTFERGSAGNAAIPEGTKKYYRVDIPDGWTAHAAVTLLMPPGTEDDGRAALNATIAFRNPGNDPPCNIEHLHLNWAQAIGMPGTVSTNSQGCDDPAYIEIHRYGSRFKETPATAEIMLRLEPPADATGLPAPEVRDAAEPPLHSSDSTAVDGGLSFNGATELAPGETYSSTVVTGEYRFFTVPVTWGQQISFRLDMTGRDSRTREMNFVRAHWYNPVRQELYDLKADSVSAMLIGGGSTEGATISGGSEEPVRYGAGRFGFDGDYYFVIGAHEAEEEPFQYTFLLTIETQGEPEDGPVYDSSAQSPSPEPSATMSEEPIEPEAPETSDEGEADSGDSTSPAVWVGVGAVGVLVLVGGGALVWRRLRS